jgi:hypothetical protein
MGVGDVILDTVLIGIMNTLSMYWTFFLYAMVQLYWNKLPTSGVNWSAVFTTAVILTIVLVILFNFVIPSFLPSKMKNATPATPTVAPVPSTASA